MKNCLALCIAFLLLSLSAAAKDDYFSHFNTDEFWQNLVLDDAASIPALAPSDTVFAVASSRKLQPGNLRFASEEKDDGRIHYFLIYTHAGKWHVLPRNSLSETIVLLPHPNNDWVVYTEGMGKIFTTDLDRGIGMAGTYSVNVLLLDYPSIHTGYSALKNYHFANHNSLNAYRDFVPVLDSFHTLRAVQKAGNGHLTLFFHSMGNSLMRKIATKNLLFMFNTTTTPWVDNLVLNSASVPRRGSRKWIENIHFSKRIFVHYNPHDGTLKWARLAAFHQVMGEHAKHPAANATYINFNTLCGYSHSNFLNLYHRPPAPKESIAHYRRLFHGEGADLQNERLYRRSIWRGIGWDILPDESRHMTYHVEFEKD